MAVNGFKNIKHDKYTTETEPEIWMQTHINGKGNTHTCYLSAINVFIHWMTETKRTSIRWKDMTMQMAEDYNAHCIERYSASRYNMLMMVLRITLEKAYKDPNIPFKNNEVVEFLKTCQTGVHVTDDGRVALTSKQVDMIYEFEPSDNIQLQVRDMFVLQCLTSLRYSNVSGADFREFRGRKEFDVIQVKEKGSGNQRIALAIDPRIEEILKRHDWHFPKINNSRYNSQVRNIIQKLPFANVKVRIKTRWADGSTHITTKPLYEAVRSHNGRRTFITELRSNPYVQDRDLMTFTGHKSLELLATYDKTTRTRRAHNVLRALRKVKKQED